MNKNSLKAAVKKYAPLLKEEGKTEQDLYDALAADEKKFSDADILEIVDAINTQSEEEAEEQHESPVKSDKQYSHTEYEEWKGEFDSKGNFEPLKRLRSGVKLNETTAEVLNGNASASNPVMYLTAEEAAAKKK